MIIVNVLILDSKAWTLRIEKRKVGWSCATSWRRWRWWEMSVVPFLPPGAIKCILYLLISPNKSEEGYEESNIAGFICSFNKIVGIFFVDISLQEQCFSNKLEEVMISVRSLLNPFFTCFWDRPAVIWNPSGWRLVFSRKMILCMKEASFPSWMVAEPSDDSHTRLEISLPRCSSLPGGRARKIANIKVE